MQHRKTKIDQLTSLRFFAAFMIVIHHSQGLFGIKPTGINFGQGVSFFFVLSGFILTYVYPILDTRNEIWLFWKARIARIWPAYFVGFLLVFWLLGSGWDNKTAIAYVLMVQAWIPYSKYYFSYNAVGWSVSTELFFYTMFPILIYKWDKTWLMKIIFSAAALITLMLISNLLRLPDYGDPRKGEEGLLITKHSLLYISPLSRIFEFVFGMCLARGWQKIDGRSSFFSATIYEIGAVTLCALSMYYMGSIAALSNIPLLSPSLSEWMIHAGSMFAFALLIYVIARGNGAVSKFLALPALVTLGEISFSLYIIHQILLNFYANNITEFPHIKNSIAFFIYLIILLLSSYLMWSWVELPARRLIVGNNVHGTVTLKRSWRSHALSNRKAFASAIGLFFLIFVLHSSMGKLQFIDQTESDNLTPSLLRENLGVSFGNRFTLRGLDIKSESDGLHIKLAWESKADQNLVFTVAIHLIDANGKILSQADYKQSRTNIGVKSGDIWLDTIFIPVDRIDKSVTGLAIAFYEDAKDPLLLIDRGTRDWDDHRLIIRIDNKH